MTTNTKHDAIDSTKMFHLPNSDIKVYVAIVLISDSLSKDKDHWREKDKSGKIAETVLNQNPFVISTFDVIPDELENIQTMVKNLIKKENINFIVTIGGTGISRRDVTIEAIKPLLEKELQGFGELFRYKTYEEKKTISIMTRAMAGVIDKTLICSLPGSPNAVQLGLNLILPEVQHILNLRI